MFFDWFQCGLIMISSISFMLGDMKCPFMKKLRIWGPKLSWRATNLHKEVAKRGFLKTLSLEHCRYRCSSGILCDTVQLCHITTGWKNATFVWLIFTFWHVCAITCSVTVGLEYVTEIQVIGQSPRYHCELCDSKFDHNLKFPHLVGSKHRFNVLVSNVDLWNSKWNCFGSNVLINMESLLKLLSGSHKWWFCQWNHYFVRETSSDKKNEQYHYGVVCFVAFQNSHTHSNQQQIRDHHSGLGLHIPA